MISRTQLSAIVGVTALVWGIALLASGLNINAQFFKPFSLVTGVVAGAVSLFDLWLWRLRVLRGWFVKRPYLRGTWRVELRPSRSAGDERIITGYMAVRQTYSTISMRLMTEESRSELLGADIVHSPDGLFRVAGVYTNEPRISARERSPIHNGAFLLQVQGNPATSLEGHYWTDRATLGEMRVSGRLDKIFDTFASAQHGFAGR